MRPAHDMATACQPKQWIPFSVVHPCRSNRKEADTAISNQIFGIAASGCRGLTLGNYRRGGRNCGRRHDMMADRRELPAGSREGNGVAAYQAFLGAGVFNGVPSSVMAGHLRLQPAARVSLQKVCRPG